MALTAKSLSHSALTATTTTTLYTVPASTSTIVKEILLCNTDTVARTVTLQAGSTSGVADRIINTLNIQANETKTISLSTVLTTGQTITGGASTGSVVSCLISGVEIV